MNCFEHIDQYLWTLPCIDLVEVVEILVELLLCQVWFYLIYYLSLFVSFDGSLRLLMFIMIIVFSLW